MTQKHVIRVDESRTGVTVRVIKLTTTETAGLVYGKHVDRSQMDQLVAKLCLEYDVPIDEVDHRKVSR